MLKCKSKYYRAHLKTAEDKLVYDSILSSLEAKQTKVNIDSSLMSKISYSLETLVLFVRLDNPGLFYVDFQKYYFSGRYPNREIVFSFLYPPSNIDGVERRISEKIFSIIESNKILHLPPFEKELAIHDFLVANVNYEYVDKSYHKSHSAVGALLHGRAVCEGYAMAFKLLCDAADISCLILYGKATNSEGTEDHAWNIVKLNEECYHIDVTWDGCIRTDTFINHNCFNLTDDEIGQDHKWDRQLLPRCTSTEYNYFIQKKTFFTSKKDLREYFASRLLQGQRNFSVKINRKFKDDSVITSIMRDSIKSSLFTDLFGNYSMKVQYDSVRDVANIFVQRKDFSIAKDLFHI